MLRGLTSDAGAVQSPQFFDIPNNASGKVPKPRPVAARTLMISDFHRKSQHAHMSARARIVTTRNPDDCVRTAKCLQKDKFRAPSGAAPLKLAATVERTIA